MKKYEKPFVKEAVIELDEILAGSDYDGKANDHFESSEDDGTAYPQKQINVWE